MPRKRKTAANDNPPPTANGSSLAADKTGKKRPRVPSPKTKNSEPARSRGKAKKEKSAKGGRGLEPTDEAIRIRAYFIAEHRQRLALPGDANNDWIEARRQLLAETSGPR